MDSVEWRCTNLVHLRSNTSVHEICLIRAFDRWQSLVYIKYILFSLTFLTLIWSSVDIYQDMITLLVFDSFKRVWVLTEFMAVDNFN